MSKQKRQDYINKILTERGYITSADIQNKFKVSAKTAHFDLKSHGNLMIICEDRKFKYVLDTRG